MNFKVIKKLGRKNLLLLGGGLFLLITLPFLVKVAREQQELRRGAIIDEPGTGQIAVYFKAYDSGGAETTTLEVGQNYTFKIGLQPDNPGARQIRAAGAQVTFDPSVISIGSVNCNPSFTDGIGIRASGNRIFLSCYKMNPPLALPYTFALGEVSFSVRSDAPAGTTSTSFNLAGANIPDGASADAPDLAKEEAEKTFDIALPVPTLTPTPTLIPDLTLTPTATPTPDMDGSDCVAQGGSCLESCYSGTDLGSLDCPMGGAYVPVQLKCCTDMPDGSECEAQNGFCSAYECGEGFTSVGVVDCPPGAGMPPAVEYCCVPESPTPTPTPVECLEACLAKDCQGRSCRTPGSIPGDPNAKCFDNETYLKQGICSQNRNCCCYGCRIPLSPTPTPTVADVCRQACQQDGYDKGQCLVSRNLVTHYCNGTVCNHNIALKNQVDCVAGNHPGHCTCWDVDYNCDDCQNRCSASGCEGAAVCAKGPKGDLNCDDQINETDLSILLGDWSPGGPVPRPDEGYHLSDIAGYQGGPDGEVDEADLNRLLSNWKT